MRTKRRLRSTESRRENFFPAERLSGDNVGELNVGVVGRIRPAGTLAALDGADRIEEPPPQRDDDAIAVREVLFRAIEDRAHALLQGDVLGIHPLDPGERARALELAVD